MMDERDIRTSETVIFARTCGSGPPLLLLHGFPETQLMWRDVAARLARRFTVVCPDLRGYGASGCPPSRPDHAPYTKRAMASDMIELMHELGFTRFSIAGHDRGGRVAYRLALDHPERVDRLAVLDVLPTADAWAHADARFALAYWPWSMLAQPSPLPERIIERAAEAIVDSALADWGTPPGTVPHEVRDAYVMALQDPMHAYAICEEYRAAATLDRAHDDEDRARGVRIVSPLLVLWSGKGALASWYADFGGPLGMWSTWANDVRGRAIDAGHFFPEEAPEQTAKLLGEFFSGSRRDRGRAEGPARV
jgi:haloacetate dehalogenase